MPFNKQDYYCSGGSVLLNETWAADVTKFDTSSFYNWEQDNEPIYDLEERTDLLWSKSGFPTSALENTGVSLTVSSTNANNVPNVYTTVQEAINALPNVIRFPIRIEVAASGELGSIKMRDLQFEASGCLEIVNRYYGKLFAKTVGSPAHNAQHNTVDAEGHILDLTANDLEQTLKDTSAVQLGQALPTTGWNTYNKYIFHSPGFVQNTLPGCRAVTYGYGNGAFASFGSSAFDTENHESMYGEDPTVATFDIEVSNITSNAVVTKKLPSAVGYAVGMVYGNNLTGIRVTNCNGPIYIRNFIVDGASGAGATYEHYISNGYEITNSEVVLENCTAVRCSTNGFYFKNSSVGLSRGCIAYRIYDVYKGLNQRRNKTDSAGLRADNSVITLSSLGDLIDLDTADNHQYSMTNDFNVVFNRCQNGIILNNSTFTGGRTRLSTVRNNYYGLISNNSKNVTTINVGLNSGYGVKAINSAITTTGRFIVYENNIGILAKSSSLELTEFGIDHNQEVGMWLVNSDVVYNPLRLPVTSEAEPFTSQFIFDYNGVHLKLDNSTFIPSEGSRSNVFDVNTSGFYGMPNLYGFMKFKRAFGSELIGTNRATIPSVQITNNSTARLVHAQMTVESSSVTAYRAVYGSTASVTNNSVLDFLGTSAGPTQISGPDTFTKQIKMAGIYAGNNSVVNFAGPTIIAQFGVDVLAEDNSIINFKPHTSLEDWRLDDSRNHTSVELHSTRACLVANRNSTLNMIDLGDYHAYWSAAIQQQLVLNGSTEIADYNPSDDEEKEYTTSGGWMQFYPNPQAGNYIYASEIAPVASGTNAVTITNNFTRYLKEPLNPSEDHHDYSYGGVCVRAVNNSVVNVKNVHFPAGWVNASGAYYDMSGLDCNNLYIWNIADESILKASYCSVSGLWPASAGYNGPTATYLSGANVAASGAPPSTPHTGALSVLDSFGVSTTNAGYHGKSEFDNKGPFRIYFSPRSSAKFLGYDVNSVLITGPVYQVLAQGYNPSGDCSSTASGTWASTGAIYSELYPELKEPTGLLSDASAFYYVSGMVDGGNGSRVRLDDSAMNTFANAKNATLGTAGRAKLVTYYRATKAQEGEGWDADTARYGLGFLSANEFDLDRNN